MTLRAIVTIVISAAILLVTEDASALRMHDFTAICDAGGGVCSDHPILQAYVGGALDLIAALDEETDHLATIYCVEPSELFDVPAIIRYMTEHAEAYADKNAMLLVVRYLETNGGC